MIEKKYKFDIFQILEKLSTKNRNFFESMSEEDLKAIQPLVLMRWMSGTSNSRQIYFLNELVNHFVFSLTKHKMLLIDLLMICGSGKPQRYNWLKPKSKKTTSTPKAIEVIKEYYGYSTLEAIEALPLLDATDIISYAEYLGKQPDELKVISKEVKNLGIINLDE